MRKAFDLTNALIAAAHEGRIASVRKLLREGAEPWAANSAALICAAAAGHLSIVRVLIAAGASVSSLNDRAVELAAKYGHPDVVMALLVAGASIDAAKEGARSAPVPTPEVAHVISQFGQSTGAWLTSAV